MRFMAITMACLASALGATGQQALNETPATHPSSIIRIPGSSETWSEFRLRWQKHVIREEPEALLVMISVSLSDLPASAELVIYHDRLLSQYQITARDIRNFGNHRTISEYDLKRAFEKLLALPTPKRPVRVVVLLSAFLRKVFGQLMFMTLRQKT